jgi:hypothetical protein
MGEVLRIEKLTADLCLAVRLALELTQHFVELIPTVRLLVVLRDGLLLIRDDAEVFVLLLPLGKELVDLGSLVVELLLFVSTDGAPKIAQLSHSCSVSFELAILLYPQAVLVLNEESIATQLFLRNGVTRVQVELRGLPKLASLFSRHRPNKLDDVLVGWPLRGDLHVDWLG